LNKQNKVLFIIILAQFFCTSVWFSSNAVILDISSYFNFDDESIGSLSSAIQFGFIIGTLFYALLSITDRFSPSLVFFLSALLSAFFNLSIALFDHNIYSLILVRAFVGFFLAGIYPVGLKIAADYFQSGLGKAFGWLVAALVLGTALPHLITGLLQSFDWQQVFYSTSLLSLTGGVLVYVLVSDGPYRVKAKAINLSDTVTIFKDKKFRLASFGYFGHMWELYTFWVFLPLITAKVSIQSETNSYLNFAIIAIGSISCIASGFIAQRISPRKTALLFISISGICCITAYYILNLPNQFIIWTFLFIWGASVIGDSPMFSTLVAQNAPPEKKGTALTIVNCFGFSLTILSIKVFELLLTYFDITTVIIVLAIGPCFSIINTWSKKPQLTE